MNSLSEPEVKLHPLLTPIIPENYPATRMQQLWEKLSLQDYAFDDFVKADPSLFLSQFAFPGNFFWELGELQGIVSAVGLQPKLGATLHFAHWGDLTITKLMQAGKSLTSYLFETHELNRLSAFIPNQNLNARRLAILLNFKEEGNLRKSFLSHGNYSDTHIFGILRSEWEKYRGM